MLVTPALSSKFNGIKYIEKKSDRKTLPPKIFQIYMLGWFVQTHD